VHVLEALGAAGAEGREELLPGHHRVAAGVLVDPAVADEHEGPALDDP